MNQEFKKCLERGRIRKVYLAKNLISKELKSSKDDLSASKKSLKNRSYKWAIVQAYYSMFHSARALLYSKGYRERSHYCLVIAIRSLFIEKRLLNPMLLDALQRGKTLRENADYYSDFSALGAKQMVNYAMDFLESSKRILIK